MGARALAKSIAGTGKSPCRDSVSAVAQTDWAWEYGESGERAGPTESGHYIAAGRCPMRARASRAPLRSKQRRLLKAARGVLGLRRGRIGRLNDRLGDRLTHIGTAADGQFDFGKIVHLLGFSRRPGSENAE
jgi:hypothetical protein